MDDASTGDPVTGSGAPSSSGRALEARRLLASLGGAAGTGLDERPGRPAPAAAGTGLDRLADLARRLLDAQAAQVVLLSEVQTVVASAGPAPRRPEATGPLDEGLCARVLLEDGPVRLDTTTDSAGSRLGVPLRTGGHVVGALCVSDRAPRRWSGRDVALLEELAGPVVAELELGALVATYEDDRLVWQLAVDAGGVGAFDWDLVTGELRWDDRLLDLFGLDRDAFAGTIEAFRACVHPEDRVRVESALRAAIDTCGTFESEYRILLPGGRTRWVEARGQAVAGPDGSAVRLLGAAHDSTARRDGDARVARVLESMPTAFYQLDADWRFGYVNGEAERLLAATRDSLIGQVVWDRFPAAVGGTFEEHYRRAVETGDPVAFEAYYPAPLDGWYEVRAWPSPDGLAVYFIDITDRRRAHDRLQEGAEQTQLLSDVSASLATTLDTEEAVRRLPQLITPRVADWSIVTLLTEPAGAGTTAPRPWRTNLRDAGHWHHDPVKRGLVTAYASTRLRALSDSAPLARAATGQQPVIHRTDATQALLGSLSPGPARDAIAALAPRSGAFIPLRARGRVVGLLSAFREEHRAPFTDEDVALLLDLGNRAGLAIDNTRLFGLQRDLAEGLQRSMLTAPPAIDHLQVAVRYAPAAVAARVGGDWYDAFRQQDGATVVVIGDVIGHDVAAAAAMGQARTLLRGIAVTTGAGPAAVLHDLEGAMRLLEVDVLATALVARLDRPDSGASGPTRLRWSNAGHLDPVAVHPDGRVETLEPAVRDPLLGIGEGPGRTEQEVVLAPGSTVVFYTDGLVERRGEHLDAGLARLSEAVRELAAEDLTLDELCDRLLARLVPSGAADDVALVAVRLGADGGSRDRR